MAIKELAAAVIAATGGLPYAQAEKYESATVNRVVVSGGNLVIYNTQRYQWAVNVALEVRIGGADNDDPIWDEIERLIGLLITLPGYRIQPGSITFDEPILEGGIRIATVNATYLMDYDDAGN